MEEKKELVEEAKEEQAPQEEKEEAPEEEKPFEAQNESDKVTKLSNNFESEQSSSSEPKEKPAEEAHADKPKGPVELIGNRHIKHKPGGENWKHRLKKKTINFLKNKWNLAFLAVLLVALIIRFKYIGQESLWNDAAVHLWYAVKAVKEPLFFFSRQYLVEEYATIQTLTAIFYLFTRNAFIAGKIVAILFGTAGIVFMYLLGSELKDKFFGLISAALLGFHHLFWFFGVRLLADAPLVSLIIITLYCLVKVEKEKTLFWGFLSAFMFLALILTKKQSVLLFIAFLIYLILFKRKEAIKNKALLISGLIPIAIITLGGLIVKDNFLFFLINWFFVGQRGLNEAGLNATKHFIWIFSWYLLIPMILGFIFILIYKKKEYYLSLVFFLFYWLSFEIGVDSPEDRYLLPLLPMGFLFASFALVKIGDYFVHFISFIVSFIYRRKWFNYLIRGLIKLLIILFIIFICWNFYSVGNASIKFKLNSYAGHQEAGEWLKENVPDGTPIFVGSPRMMQAFVEREYGGPKLFEEGGSLWYLRAQEYLDNRTAFEEDLEILLKKSDVYLQIDVWEYTQPSWYYPITQDSLFYFESLGFEPVKFVQRETAISNGQKVIVIGIFKCDKRN